MILKIAKKSQIEEKHKLLSKIRTHLKNNDMAKDLLKKYKIKDWILDAFPLDFKEMKVTAKTINGTVYLNPNVIKMNFDIIMRYVIHEFVHVLQHISEEKNGEDTEDDKVDDYLDRDDEIEAFQHQVAFDADNRGEKEAEEYVDELLEFHKIPKKERAEKKKELMKHVD